MPMPVRVVALAEQRGILVVGECGVVDPVRGVEAQPSRDGDDRHQAINGKRAVSGKFEIFDTRPLETARVCP